MPPAPPQVLPAVRNEARCSFETRETRRAIAPHRCPTSVEGASQLHGPGDPARGAVLLILPS